MNNAAKTLDKIRDGGAALVTFALDRLRETETALQEGRFDDALDRGQEALSRISALAQAENVLGTFGESYVVRGQDVEEGTVLKSWGRVERVEREMIDSPGNPPHIHVTIHVEGDDEPKEVVGEQELIALRAA